MNHKSGSRFLEFQNVLQVISEKPEDEINAMPKDSFYIIMTHNHQMDFAISHKILKRGDFSYLGLIASDTKWRRFKLRYESREVDPELIERINCPIGLNDISGKRPMEIAVSVAAKIIQEYNINHCKKEKAQGLKWHDLSELISE